MLAFRMMFVLVSKDRGSDVNKLKINMFDEFDPNKETKECLSTIYTHKKNPW